MVTPSRRDKRLSVPPVRSVTPDGGENIIDEIVSTRSRLNDQILESQAQAKRFVTQARGHLNTLQMFRAEIASDLAPIMQQLDQVKLKFASKIYDKEINPDGVLMSLLDDYHRCLDLRLDQLELLFEADDSKWELNLRQTKDALARMNQQLSTLSATQESILAEILNPSKFIELQQPKIKLRKVPIFGEDVPATEYDFEWPKTKDLVVIGDLEKVRLQSFYMISTEGEDYQPISRVTCLFSNGVKSPNLESSTRHDQQDQVCFDPDRPIRQIKASVYPEQKIPCVYFFDEDQEEVACYDPEGYGLTQDSSVRIVNPGEELIGVYGVRNQRRWFTSLGFIVCKKVYPKTVEIDETLTQVIDP